MGNRAVITTNKQLEDIGVYLHWNGGRDSVEAFLTYCKMKGFRSPETDNYGWARLAQVCANFFGGDGLSVGVDVASKLDYDNFDNGTYIIADWKIVDRLYFEGIEQQEYPLLDMLLAIDERMPSAQRLGAEKIKEQINCL